jgi:hypothetical protein
MAAKKKQPEPKVELPDVSKMRSISTVESRPTRSSSGDEMALVSHQSSKVRFAGRRFHPKTVPTCSICTNREERDLIEERLRLGDTAKVINDMLSPETKPLHRQTCKTHREHHMIYDDAMHQVLMRHRAEALGVDYEEVGSMLTFQHVTDTAVREAYRQMTAGLVEFKGTDITQLVKIIAQREADAGGSLDENAFALAMTAMIEVFRKHMARLGTDRDMEWVSADLSEHPIIKALMDKAGGRPTPEREPLTMEMLDAAEIIEVEYVEEDEPDADGVIEPD